MKILTHRTQTMIMTNRFTHPSFKHTLPQPLKNIQQRAHHITSSHSFFMPYASTAFEEHSTEGAPYHQQLFFFLCLTLPQPLKNIQPRGTISPGADLLKRRPNVSGHVYYTRFLADTIMAASPFCTMVRLASSSLGTHSKGQHKAEYIAIRNGSTDPHCSPCQLQHARLYSVILCRWTTSVFNARCAEADAEGEVGNV